ncbi:hypothetical protein VNI00_014263 [Paramarasmius palmivorus]|uniref:Uncharacterized protein n=1 Tax=Paramarasmius palmivorus TaxID=297713 RepID=A0AAW0BT14_9AGAR
MKYLEIDEEDPKERLEDIIRIKAEDLPESPYPDLDLLYHQILKTCLRWDEVRRVLQLILTIPNVYIPTIMVSVDNEVKAGIMKATRITRMPCSRECITAILGFKPGKVQSLLIKLHAVLDVPVDDEGVVHIPHASFSEFLLDSRRSKGYHVEQHTDSDYRDLLVQAFLRTISVRSKEYWGHVSNSGPLDFDSWKFFTKGPPLVRVFRIVPLLESLSPELTTSLNQFDPYPLAAAVFNSLSARELNEEWRRIIQWGKSIGIQAIQKFVDKMESCLLSFRIASPHRTSLRLWEALANLEEAIHIQRSSWRAVLGVKSKQDSHNIIYFFPADRHPPSSWVSIAVTHENAKPIARLFDSLGRCNTEILKSDIHKDTSESVYYFPNKVKVAIDLPFLY